MADTADALMARVKSARKGILGDTDGPNLAGEIGIDPMLLSLAMELALKAWITFDQGPKTIREHNLAKLFGMLKPDQRERIESEFQTAFPWRSLAHINPRGADVASILDHHADAFVKWRYVHEMERGSFCASDMEYALESVLKLFRKRYTTRALPYRHP
jgi:hypothetical protein